MKYIYLPLLLLLFIPGIQAITIIPYPYKVEVRNGIYPLSDCISVFSSERNSFEEKELISFLTKELGISVKREKYGKADIKLCINEGAFSIKEAYALTIDDAGIKVMASDAAGIFYAIQTLRQLVEKKDNRCFFPCVEIEDKPRFEWRAMLLDEARTFQGKDIVKRLIRSMSMLKMNKLQWHLTDLAAGPVSYRTIAGPEPPWPMLPRSPSFSTTSRTLRP